MIIILKDESLLKKMLSLLIEFELYDATVLDGESIENVASKKIALFSDLNSLFGSQGFYNRTIICYVPDDEIVSKFIKVCKKEGIDFKKPELGSIMIVPCSFHIGEENL